MHTRFIWSVIVLTELGIIVFLLFGMNERPVSILMVSKESAVAAPRGELAHFYEPRPDFSDTVPPWWEVEPFVTKTNSDGIVSDKEYEVRKPEQVFRIAVMGDSFVYGIAIPTEKNFSSLLEQKLNASLRCGDVARFEVLNMGERGYDLRYMAERFISRGLKYDPDIAIFYVKNDDLTMPAELLSRHYDEELRPFLKSGGDMSESVYRSAQKDAEEQLMSDSLESRLSFSYAAFPLIAAAYPRPVIVYAQRVVNPSARELVSLERELGQFSTFRLYESDMKFAATEAYPDGHPNPAGHAKIADDLYAYLLSGVLKGRGCVGR